MGVHETNCIIIEKMRQWLLQTARDTASAAGAASRAELHVKASHCSMLLQMGRGREAEPLLHECLAAQRRVLGDSDAATLASMKELGCLLMDTGRTGEAEPLLRESLQRRRAAFGSLPPKYVIGMSRDGPLVAGKILLTGLNSMAVLLRKQHGGHQEALALMEECAKLERELNGEVSAELMSNLAIIRSSVGAKTANTDAAQLASLQEVHKRLSSKFGEAHPNSLTAANNIAVVLLKGGELERAEECFRRHSQLARQHLGLANDTTIGLICGLAKTLVQLSRVRDAVPFFQEELRGRLQRHDEYRLDAGMELIKLLREHAYLWPGEDKAGEVVQMAKSHGVDLIAVRCAGDGGRGRTAGWRLVCCVLLVPGGMHLRRGD